MGYFANATEHEMYVEEYCEKCRNWYMRPVSGGVAACYNSCPIMDMHFLVATMKDEEPLERALQVRTIREEVLDLFIPREGVENLQCTMFADIERSDL